MQINLAILQPSCIHNRIDMICLIQEYYLATMATFFKCTNYSRRIICAVGMCFDGACSARAGRRAMRSGRSNEETEE